MEVVMWTHKYTRLAIGLAVSLLVTSCGNFWQAPRWPGVISSFGTMTESEKTMLMGFIESANNQVGETVIRQENNQVGFPITVTIVDPPAENPNRAGFTIRTGNSCQVQFSTALRDPEKADYWESVVLHEIYGHCLGMGHTQQPGTIMYPTTDKYQSYSREALSSFFKSVVREFPN